MTMRVVCLLLSAVAAFGQQTGGRITGRIVDETGGRGLVGAKVYAIRLTPTALTTAAVTTGPNGAFELAPLAAGTYKLCAGEVASYASTCVFLDRSDAVTVNWGAAASATVRLQKGARLTIRVNDASGALKRVEGTKPIGMLMLLTDGKGNEHPMIPAVRDAGGFLYDLVVPADVPLRLTAKAFGAAVRDEGNGVVAAAGSQYPFTASSAAGQRAFTFTVTGAQ